jgi:hypothetical protein
MRTFTLLMRVLSVAGIGALVFGCATQPGPQSARGPESSQSQAPVKISPEQAFRKGILALKDKVDFYDKTGVIKFYRLDSGSWYMQVTKYPGVPIGGIWVKIEEDGQVETGYGF